MKIIGIVFIFFSLSAAGAIIGENYLSVLKSIKRAENFLNILLIGLEGGRLSVNEMLESAAKSGDEETVKFVNILKGGFRCGSLAASEQDALKSNFCKDETAVLSLLEAISILGKCSAEEQIDKIKYCRENLRKRYAAAFPVYSQKAKLSRSSGILAGLLAAVILI